jgi:hypothetical protein
MDLSAPQARAFARHARHLALAALVLSAAPSAAADTPAKTFPPLPATIQVAGLPEWLRANTDIPPASLVSLIKGMATIVVDRGAPDSTGVRTVVVRREALSDFATGVVGGRSELVRLEVNCNAAQYRLVSRDIHSGSGLTGSDRLIAPSSTMASVPPNTDLAFLVQASCNPNYQPPLTPYLAAAAAAQGPAAAAAAAPAPTPQPAAQPASARPLPALAQPLAPAARPQTLVAQAQPAAQPAQPASPPPRPPPPPPHPQPQAVAARTPPAPVPSPAARQVRQTGKFVAQVTASNSEALARRYLADMTRRAPEVAGLPTTVERVRVNDAFVYRVSVVGFPTSAAAEAFCVKLRAARFPCWVR